MQIAEKRNDKYFRFSQQCCWGFTPSWMWHFVAGLVVPDVLKDHCGTAWPLKMKKRWCFKLLGKIQVATQRHIPKDINPCLQGLQSRSNWKYYSRIPSIHQTPQHSLSDPHFLMHYQWHLTCNNQERPKTYPMKGYEVLTLWVSIIYNMRTLHFGRKMLLKLAYLWTKLHGVTA